ncbi:MAG TPA: Rpn family recombination-promoting nuclease/putative transposase [Polyangiaceae bacterium]|nr:Rpn family recombination-promoting nuclease/putative transposase [Polyangiaceae bacterium]
MTVQDLLNPKLDLVFKMLFAKANNKELLLSLLNATLKLQGAAISFELLNPELPKQAVDDKGVVLDVLVRLADGQQVDVEMQAQARAGRRERALFHWARMFSGQLARGGHYHSLKRCLVVFILDFVELSGNNLHSVFSVRDEHRNEKLSDHFELHFLELPKRASAPASRDETMLWAWCKFLCASTEREFQELAMIDPIFQRAKKALEELSRDPEARRQVEDREAALLLYEAEMAMGREEAAAQGRAEGHAQGRAEGHAQGRAEGRGEGRAELLAELLERKFGPLPAHVLRRVQEARPEELSSWSERLFQASALSDLFTS